MKNFLDITTSNIIERGRKRPAIKTYGEKSRLKICLHWYDENHHYFPLGPYNNKKQEVEAIDVVVTTQKVKQQKHRVKGRVPKTAAAKKT
jgi:hypothetical protein